MNRCFLLVGLVLIGFGIAGCIPEKRVNWAPDGKKATVIGGDRGLYLCDGQGTLTEPLASGVRCVAWFPDSQRLAIVQTGKVTTWTDLAAMLTPDLRQRVVTVGEALNAEVQAYTGKWDDFPAHALSEVGGPVSGAVTLYVRDTHADTLSVKLGPEQWAEVKDADIEVYTLCVARISAGALTIGEPLVRSIFEPEALRVSPLGTSIAFATSSVEHDDVFELYVRPVDGSATPRLVAAPVARFADWSANGRDLVFAGSGQRGTFCSDALHLGVIARRHVCAADGTPLESFSEQEDLAGILFLGESRVRCLRDGRIVFAALEVQLPCTTADMPDRAGLFTIDPGRTPGVTRLIPRQAAASFPDAVGMFEVSPDEQRICVPGGNGEIAVLTIATGDVQTYLSSDTADGVKTWPCWRSDTELCFAVHGHGGGNAARSEIVLCKVNDQGESSERKIISKDWPENIVLGFLQKEPEANEDSQ